jgi:hypothetical protein
MPDLHPLANPVKAAIRHSYNRDSPLRTSGADATGLLESGAANSV